MIISPDRPFALFIGDNYYPAGGTDDFHGSYETREGAETELKGWRRGDWAQVVDVRTGEETTYTRVWESKDEPEWIKD